MCDHRVNEMYVFCHPGIQIYCGVRTNDFTLGFKNKLNSKVFQPSLTIRLNLTSILSLSYSEIKAKAFTK